MSAKEIRAAAWSTKRPRVRSFAEANCLLPMGRNFLSRKIANHTYLKRRDNGIAVTLWGHDILLYYPDERVRLNSCGYETYVTKARMNQFSTGKFSVYSERGVWKVWFGPHGFTQDYWESWACGKCWYRAHYPAGSEHPGVCLRCGWSDGYHNGPFKTVPFADGMIIHPDGQVTGAPPAIQYKQKYDNRNDLFFGIFAPTR